MTCISSSPKTRINSRALSLSVELENDRPNNVQKYSQFDYKSGTTWLAFRDIPRIFDHYVSGRRGIDYGCGSGRSTRFLSGLGLDPIGVDISQNMINEAKKIDSRNKTTHRYEKIESGKINMTSKTCDFVFSSFVFLVIPSKNEMNRVLKEMHRVLKDEGSAIIITGTEEMHSPNREWVSYETNYPENRSSKSGAQVKLKIREVGAEFIDYNWLREDYEEVFNESDFVIAEKINPLGNIQDNCSWKDEMDHSPYHIFVLKKQTN